MPKVYHLTHESAATLDIGLARHKSGDLDGALAAYDTVLARYPNQPEALSLKATLLLQRGNSRAACEIFELAVQLRTDDAVIWNDFGMALEAAGDDNRAADCFEKAVLIEPTLSPAQVNDARAKFREGKLDGALTAAEMAVKSDPSLSTAHNIHSAVLLAHGRADQALSAAVTAISLDPGNQEALVNKGLAELDLEKYQDASATFQQAILKADAGSKLWSDSLVGVGLAYSSKHELDAALECFERVLERLPNHIEALFNRAEVLGRQGHIEEAEQGYQQCLAIEKDYRPARYNLGILNLLRGRWSKGWPDYELRWVESVTSSKIRDHGLMRWHGEKTAPRRLLVWGEQGLGDQILFASILPDLFQHHPDLALEVDARLAPLISRAFPKLPVFGYDAVPEKVIANRDAQVPLSSLGLYYRSTVEAFPPPAAYLAADSDKKKTFDKAYGARANGRLKVGIAWRSIHPTLGDGKSLPLSQWHPIFDAADAHFVSLQYGDTEKEISDSGFDDRLYVDNDLDPRLDFDGAAAQIDSLDLVICTSGTAAHLAGALGKETWVMVPKVPEWRWGLKGDKALWYPDVTLFRQHEHGDWTAPISAVAARLAARMLPQR